LTLLEYKYTPITLAIGRESGKGSGYRFIGLVTKSVKESWIKTKLPEGNYIAYVNFNLYLFVVFNGGIG
jgi:hypothetical protein